MTYELCDALFDILIVKIDRVDRSGHRVRKLTIGKEENRKYIAQFSPFCRHEVDYYEL
jgi:hypothetical protein